jgi:hypothetical protein
MKNFDTRTYSISDFVEWEKNGLLELSPDFQRRSVWSEKGKSYLIDTIMRGKPIPKIIITQKLQGARNLRVVVDGQQRLRAILSFYNGDFKISKAHNKDLSKHNYHTLSEELKKEFLKYELGVDVLFDLPYEDILDIFARINSYTVELDKQEIFNAKYLGYFKQTAYGLGYKYVNYFINGGIITKAKVARMAEADLASDLLIALIGSVQTNKNIEVYYKEYEDKQGNLEDIEKRFDKIMSYIGSIYKAEEIKNTNWSRIHLFYTLFTSIGHFLYGIKGLGATPKKAITVKSIGKLRNALDNFSSEFDEIAADLDNPDFSQDFKQFIYYSRRGTTDTSARIFRSNFLCKKIKNVF